MSCGCSLQQSELKQIPVNKTTNQKLHKTRLQLVTEDPFILKSQELQLLLPFFRVTKPGQSSPVASLFQTAELHNKKFKP